MNQLKDMVEKHNLIIRSSEYLWILIEQYREKQPIKFRNSFGKFDRQSLNINVSNVAYKIKDWPECRMEYLVVRMEFYHKKRFAGEYDVVYSMKGEIKDSYFVTYPV